MLTLTDGLKDNFSLNEFNSYFTSCESIFVNFKMNTINIPIF